MGFLGNRRYDTTVKVTNVEIEQGGSIILNEGTTINNVEVTNIVEGSTLFEPGTGVESIRSINTVNLPTNDASGDHSLAVGGGVVASGDHSQAFGFGSVASGTRAHAEGSGTEASGTNSHSEGSSTIASGNSSHAEGSGSESLGNVSHAGGLNNTAETYSETVIGINSTIIAGNATTFVATDPVFRVGNGTTTGARSDAFRVYKNGSSYFKPVTQASIASPTAGQVIFDSGTSSLKFYSGSAWVDTNPASASSLWEVGSAADSIQQKDTNAVASGIRAFAVGNGVTTDGSLASGTDSIAFAGGEASGLRSFAHGTSAIASGVAAISFGGNSSGGASFSINGTSSGVGSVSFSNGQASGDRSLAVGDQARAETYSETVIGTFPTIITGNATGITATDPVFRVGNGTDILSRNDAFRVYKNGSFYMKPVTQASIGSPVVGQLIWNSSTNSFNLFNGSAWDEYVKVTTATTGTTISFARPQIWNSPSSPATGNITDSLTGAVIGTVQKIYHNSGTAPTFPAGWVLLSGTYTTSTLNIIYAEWVSGTRVEYWIIN